jgi:phosphoribosylanthranilate isomerase
VSRVKVKICGIRSLEEAEVAVDAGADALGFNFWTGSPRWISPETARQIIARLAPLVFNIGVFVNETRETIEAIASDLGLAAVQLHGDESPEFCGGITGVKTIKALRVNEHFEPEIINRYPVSMILLDAAVEGSYGGTGRSLDWNTAADCARLAPVILAGGLNAANVAEAITTVRPAAIDVCSGVEAEPGRKDLEKLRSFMVAAELGNSLLQRAGGPQCL